MEYDFDIPHRAGVEQQVDDALSRLLMKVMDDSDIHDESPVMVVATCTQKGLTKVQYETTDKSHTMTNGPQLPTLFEIMSAKRTDLYCDSTRQTVGISASCLNFIENGLLV